METICLNVEMSNPAFWKNKKNVVNLLSAELGQSVLNALNSVAAYGWFNSVMELARSVKCLK